MEPSRFDVISKRPLALCTIFCLLCSKREKGNKKRKTNNGKILQSRNKRSDDSGKFLDWEKLHI